MKKSCRVLSTQRRESTSVLEAARSSSSCCSRTMSACIVNGLLWGIGVVISERLCRESVSPRKVWGRRVGGE
jgi:hypothetical protein